MSVPGIVIVTHNSAGAIGACLDSLRPVGAEVVVVDNASEDETRAEVLRRPEVRLIANPWNRGFAAGVNQGIQVLDSEFVLVLNPDTELISGLDGLVEACREPGVAAAGGKLVDESGRAQGGFMVRRFPGPAALCFELLGVNRLWPGNPVNRRYRCLDADPEAAAEVDQPAGAFLLVRRAIWRELGGFDESFHPLWFEDVDFCKRARGRGYGIRYVPWAVARHRGAHSVRQLAWETRELYWCGNLLTYAAKHFRPLHLWAVCGAVGLGSVVRAVLGIFRRGSLKPIWICGSVIRLAGRSLRPGSGEGAGLSSAFAGR